MNKILSINLKFLIIILVIFPFTMNSQNVLITDDATFSTPATLLHVHKAGISGANLLQLTSGATGTNASNGFKIQLNADKSIVLDNQENAGLNFYTNKIGRFFIQADGKIAIGGAGVGFSRKWQPFTGHWRQYDPIKPGKFITHRGGCSCFFSECGQPQAGRDRYDLSQIFCFQIKGNP